MVYLRLKLKLTILSLFVLQISFSQVVINEVMHAPGPSSSSNQGLRRKEYVEIYNASCSPVDISCWIVGSSMYGLLGNYIGAFQFPNGTILPANQHLVIGGSQVQSGSAWPAGAIDYDVNNYLGSYVCDPNTNWLMPNTVGMMALYNNTGQVMDAIYWGSAASVITTDSDFDSGLHPCDPTGGANTCPAVAGNLKNAREIYNTNPAAIAYVGAGTSFDKTFSRVPDGGAWTRDVNPSIVGSNCNNGVCASSFTLTAAVVQPTCGAPSGSITLTPNPAGTYTYTWTPNVSSTNAALSLSAGTYQINIQASGGCTKDTTITIANSNGPTAVDVTVNDASCGASDGSVQINSVTGGTPGYQYNFNGAGFSGTTNYTGLSSGTYSLIVRDNTGCTYTAPSIVINGGSSGLNATIAPTPNSDCAECNYNGPSIMINEINIFPVNGDGSIYGPGPNAVSEGEWIELYNPDWCDSVDISGYILGSYNSTTSLTPPTSNGMAFVIPDNTPKVPPLGFAVVRGQNAPVPGIGVVDIIVNNNSNNACIQGGINTSRIWFQNNPGGWFAFYDASGVPQDAISWGTPTASDLNGNPCIPPNNNLPVGFTQLPSYNAIGTGANLGTAVQGQTKVRIPDAGPWSATASPSENFSYGQCNDPANCLSGSGISQCNGTATVTPTSGSAPFSYSWNDPAGQTSQTALNLCPGDYEVTVTDAGGCSDIFTVTILDDAFTITAVGNDPSCSNNDGTIQVTTSTAGTYTYTWSVNTGISNTTTTQANGLSAATYTVSVSGGACIRDTAITLVAPPPITNLSVNTYGTTCGLSNGSVAVNSVTGGTAPYSYSFDGQTAALVDTFFNLPALATYDLLVEDAAGCTYLLNNIVVDGSQGINSADIAVVNANCGATDGAIAVSNVQGGLAPYTYNLNAVASVSGAYQNLGAGNYNLVITDDNSCTYGQLIVIPTNASPENIFVPNVITMNGDNTNDLWFVKADCVEKFECSIINRWGNLIYEYQDISGSWNGKDLSGTNVSEGVYFYKFNITFFGGNQHELQGFITVTE